MTGASVQPHRREDQPPLESYSDLQEAKDSRETDQASSLPEKIARYSAAKERTDAMRGYLETLTSPAAVNARRKLSDCGNYLHFRHYFTVGKVLLHAACFCKQHLICPLCAIRRGSKTLVAYLERFEIIQGERPELRPFMVTFTVKNGPDLAERFKHLRDCFKALQGRRHRFFQGKRGAPWTEFCRVEGAVGSYETTNTGKGWHPHLHMVAMCAAAPDQQALRNEWEGITGDSFMVDVRPFNPEQDPATGFMEVLKYALKFSTLSLPDNWEAAQVLARARLLFSIGVFRGVDVPEGLTDEPLEGLPYFDLFYRYFRGLGYSLQSPDATPVGAGGTAKSFSAA
jgi:Replication protein